MDMSDTLFHRMLEVRCQDYQRSFLAPNTAVALFLNGEHLIRVGRFEQGFEYLTEGYRVSTVVSSLGRRSLLSRQMQHCVRDHYFAIAEASTLRVGEVSKRGRFLNTWKDRFLVLGHSSLHYYATLDDWHRGRKPRGTIHFSALMEPPAEERLGATEPGGGDMPPFTVALYSKKENTLVLRTARSHLIANFVSQELMLAWKRSIERAWQRYSIFVQTPTHTQHDESAALPVLSLDDIFPNRKAVSATGVSRKGSR